MTTLTQSDKLILEETLKEYRSLAENHPMNLVVKSREVNGIFEKMNCKESFCKVVNQILDNQE